MILLIPIGLLLVASLAIIILNYIRPKYGTSWLIAAVASVLAWLFIFYLRLRLPTSINILSWEITSGNLWGNFLLLLDYDSWPYTLALTTILLAVILTDAARTRFDSTPKSWSASLAIAALGLMAIQSGTGVMMMFTWVFVDIVELAYLLGLEESSPFTRRMIGAFGIRIASVVTLSLATAVNWQLSGTSELTQIVPGAGFLFLLSAGLRLGVFPLNLPFLQEPSLRRGVGNIIRLAPVVASLSLLVRLPSGIVTANITPWMPLFHLLLTIASLYASLRWLTAGNPVDGRPYWIVCWASLAVASVINGMPKASLAWGIALILPGGLLFLYTPRIQRMNFLLFFGLIGLTGLPFTPAASGWSGLAGSQLNVWTFFYVIAHSIMILGYLKLVLMPGREARTLESWARLVYPMGLIVIIQSTIALGLVGWPESLTSGFWWLPLISTLIVLGAAFIIGRSQFSSSSIRIPNNTPFYKAMNWILPKIEPVFRLEWMYHLAWRIYNIISIFLKAFSTILEGDGGMLWTLLLLVLLISLLTSIGSQ